jgi:hypothetical protein
VRNDDRRTAQAIYQVVSLQSAERSIIRIVTYGYELVSNLGAPPLSERAKLGNHNLHPPVIDRPSQKRRTLV